MVGDTCLASPDLAGIHFTGSTAVFRQLWREVGERIASYRSYPRIVGETGGKDFILAHPDCDKDALIVALLRGAFEFQGQKCSAASRAYVPSSVWSAIKDTYVAEVNRIVVGDVSKAGVYMGAVHQKAFVPSPGPFSVLRTMQAVTS